MSKKTKGKRLQPKHSKRVQKLLGLLKDLAKDANDLGEMLLQTHDRIKWGALPLWQELNDWYYGEGEGLQVIDGKGLQIRNLIEKIREEEFDKHKEG